MSGLALGSVDWRSVSLLHGDHLRAETAFVEEMVRWVVQHGLAGGVVLLEEGDLQVSGSPTDYEITLRRCKAITPGGYLVSVDENSPVDPLQGGNDRHRNNPEVPIYLGVSLEKQSGAPAPSQSMALLDCQALRWRCALSCDTESAQYDWLQIGQMRRDGTRFVLDQWFIPPCTHLRSHPALRAVAADIARAAARCLEAVEKTSRKPTAQGEGSLAWRSVLGLFAQALAPAAILVDWAAPPGQYLERLAIMLRAQAAIINLIEASDSTWIQANGLIREALEFILGDARPPSYLTQALARTREALEALQVLLEGLTPVVQAAPEVEQHGSTVVRSGRPFDPIRSKLGGG